MKINKLNKIITIIFFFLTIVGVVVLVYINFPFHEDENLISIQDKESQFKNVYNFGNIKVLKRKKIIKFPAKVKKNKGKVKFLIYLKGYKWLKSESAIISKSLLSDLQKSIALINWKLWDDIWYRRDIPKEKKLTIYVKWKKDKEEFNISADRLIYNSNRLNIRDYIFMGTPFLDETVLRKGYGTSICEKCPLYSVEKKIIKNKKYKLNNNIMPAVGKKVRIVIEFK